MGVGRLARECRARREDGRGDSPEGGTAPDKAMTVQFSPVAAPQCAAISGSWRCGFIAGHPEDHHFWVAQSEPSEDASLLERLREICFCLPDEECAPCIASRLITSELASMREIIESGMRLTKKVSELARLRTGADHE